MLANSKSRSSAARRRGMLQWLSVLGLVSAAACTDELAVGTSGESTVVNGAVRSRQLGVRFRKCPVTI